MKHILINGMVAATLFFTATSYADYTFKLGENDCSQLAGSWLGTGTASSWLLGECIYHGTGIMSSVDEMGNFTADVKADKDSGNILCPNHTIKKIKGFCFNGVVTLKTDYGHLDGDFTSSSGNAKGTLSVAPGVSADVNVQFIKMS
jgi:hypothetical protein